MATNMITMVFRAITPCSSELSLLPAPAAFVLRLSFDPEHGDDMFTRSVEMSPNYTVGTIQPTVLLECYDEPAMLHAFSISSLGTSE
jgi:hypothetical protein